MFCFCLMTLVVLINCAESLNLNVDKEVVHKGVVHKLLNGKKYDKNSMDYDEESKKDDADDFDESDVLDDVKTTKDLGRKINKAQKDVVYLDKTSNREYILKGLTGDDGSTEKILLEKFQVTPTISEKSIESQIEDDDYIEKTFTSDDNTIGTVENEMSIVKDSLQLTSQNATTLSELLIISEAPSDFLSHKMSYSFGESYSEQKKDLMPSTDTLTTNKPLQSEESVTSFSSEQSTNFMTSMKTLETSPEVNPSSQSMDPLIISVISAEQQTETPSSQSIVKPYNSPMSSPETLTTLLSTVFPFSYENPTNSMIFVTSEAMTLNEQQSTIKVSSETQSASTLKEATSQLVTTVSPSSSEESIISMTMNTSKSSVSTPSSVELNIISSMVPSVILANSPSLKQLMTSTASLETSSTVTVKSSLESIVLPASTLTSEQTTIFTTSSETQSTNAFTHTLELLTTSLSTPPTEQSISFITFTETLPTTITLSKSMESLQTSETTSLIEQLKKTSVMSTSTEAPTTSETGYSSEQPTESVTSKEIQSTEPPTSVTFSFEQPTTTSTESKTTTTSSDSEIITYGESLVFSKEKTTINNYEEFNNLTTNELSFEENDDMPTDETIYQLMSDENATTMTELLMDETANSLSITNSSKLTKSMESSINSKLPNNSMTSTETSPLSSLSENSISSLSTSTTTVSIVPSIISVASFSFEILINKTTSLEKPAMFTSTVLPIQVNSQKSSAISISTKVQAANKESSIKLTTNRVSTTITPKFKHKLSPLTNLLSTFFNVSSQTPQTFTEFAPVCNFSVPNYDAGNCRLPCKVKGSQIKITAGCCCLL